MGDGGDVADLGRLDGAVWVFGTPGSNLQATEALIARAGGAGVPRERRICTGDLVAYAAHPAETAELVLAETGCVVAGNCERQLADGAEECGCGFEDGSACDRLSAGWYAHARREVGEALRRRFAALPGLAVFEHSGRRWAVVHGGATDIARYIWPDAPEAVFKEERAAIEARAGRIDAVLAGHAGIAFHRRAAGIDWVNAGALGLPPHDGRPQTRFVVIAADGRVSIERLSYDHAAAAAAMREAGLPEAYARTLQTGIWPSEEVLPASLRRA